MSINHIDQIDSFIEKANSNISDDAVKAALVGFATEARDDSNKAEALINFIDNYTENGILSDEIWSVPAHAIEDFYNDFLGNGTEIAADGTGVLDEPEEEYDPSNKDKV